MDGGSEFSFEFPFNKGRKQRDNFDQPEASKFFPGQAHYCVWWAMGQLVRSFQHPPFLLKPKLGQMKEAVISNDVVTGKPPAPLSKRAQKLKNKKRGKGPVLSKNKPPPLTDDSTLSSSQEKPPSVSTSSLPSSSQPATVGDGHDTERIDAWNKLFDIINEALQIASMLVERLNPDLALQYHQLSEGLKANTKKHGEFLALNESFLPGLALHCNMQPDDKDFHWDSMSMFAGFVSFLDSNWSKTC